MVCVKCSCQLLSAELVGICGTCLLRSNELKQFVTDNIDSLPICQILVRSKDGVNDSDWNVATREFKMLGHTWGSDSRVIEVENSAMAKLLKIKNNPQEGYW